MVCLPELFLGAEARVGRTLEIILGWGRKKKKVGGGRFKRGAYLVPVEYSEELLARVVYNRSFCNRATIRP